MIVLANSNVISIFIRAFALIRAPSLIRRRVKGDNNMIEYIAILQEMRNDEERKFAYLKSLAQTKKFSVIENQFVKEEINKSRLRVNALDYCIYQRMGL